MVTQVSQHILMVSSSIQLEASPDARVIDPSCNLIGIAEFKCPYTKRDQSPYELCTDAAFYGDIRVHIASRKYMTKNSLVKVAF